MRAKVEMKYLFDFLGVAGAHVSLLGVCRHLCSRLEWDRSDNVKQQEKHKRSKVEVSALTGYYAGRGKSAGIEGHVTSSRPSLRSDLCIYWLPSLPYSNVLLSQAPSLQRANNCIRSNQSPLHHPISPLWLYPSDGFVRPETTERDWRGSITAQ